MKSTALFVAASLCLSMQSMAQSFEIGLNGGVSTTSRPNQSLYQGANGKLDYATAASLHYNISDRWQIGASAGLTRWERYENWDLYGSNNAYLGPHQVNYVFAKNAFDFSLKGNYVIPFYQRWEDYVKAYIYIGVSVGGVVAGNDGNLHRRRANSFTPAEYMYTASYHFQGGYGFALGSQVGFSYFFNERFGLNLDFSPKIAWMETQDHRFGGANSQYNLYYFPVTAGLKFRLGDY